MGHPDVFKLTIVILFVGTYCQSDIRKPPIIIDPKGKMDVYNVQDAKFYVNCTADGQPAPTYRWTKDGTDIVPSTYVTYDSTMGWLSFSDFSLREEGTYMCIASNVFPNDQGGRITVSSWSGRVRVWLSRVEKFDSQTVIKEATANEYTVLYCNKKTVVGRTVLFNWYKADRTGINMDGGRLYNDLNGDLHFTYVKNTDSQLEYYCGISTTDNSAIILGTQNILTVKPATQSVAIRPQIQRRNLGVKGLRFSSVRLECMFSGYDPALSSIPDTQWKDDAGQWITTSQKYSFLQNGRVLIINNLQEEDERTYYCLTRNSAGEASSEILLNVTSEPIFVYGAPSDQTKPENTDATINCDARSASGENPPGPPVWFINGIKMGSQNDPNKFQLSDNNKILTIKNLKKATDIMCIQCEVSNDIDTVTANACLNVLLPITITNSPKLTQSIRYGDSVDMTVTASTDPAMILSYKWEFNNISYEGSRAPPFMVYNPNTMQAYINTSKLTQDEYGAIAGVWRRVIYHVYETKNVDFEILLADRQGASTAGGGIDLWIIGLIIALIILIIVILIIIYIICRKKQEGDYNVDKKETGAGLDPERELKDKEFNAYSRPPNYEGYNNDYPDSKPPVGDPDFDEIYNIGDDESLGEYAKEDITYFNEDGSFIGIYQNKPQPPPPPTESTI